MNTPAVIRTRRPVVLIVLSGLSGSGKSTLAASLKLERQPCHVLCSDEYNHCYRPGQDVTQFLIDTAFAHLKHGMSVIVDAVNRHPGDFPRWQRLGESLGVDLHWIGLNVSPAECIARDALRPFPVGEAIIRAQI